MFTNTGMGSDSIFAFFGRPRFLSPPIFPSKTTLVFELIQCLYRMLKNIPGLGVFGVVLV